MHTFAHLTKITQDYYESLGLGHSTQEKENNMNAFTAIPAPMEPIKLTDKELEALLAVKNAEAELAGYISTDAEDEADDQKVN